MLLKCNSINRNKKPALGERVRSINPQSQKGGIY